MTGPLQDCKDPKKPKIRQLNITKVSNGFVVNVNCKTFCFETLASMLKAMQSYYEHPDEWEKEYNDE